jgi:hypothetical protein
MAERREEKYLINYSEYSVISSRIKTLLQPDTNGKNGKYSICSMYFDDAFDTALAEKEDGNAVHIKFRIRTYDGSDGFIRLERKTKRGIVTEKHSERITKEELDKILSGEAISDESKCFGLVSEMRARAFKPVISVRYDREAYYMPSLGVRVTFDINVDSLPPDKDTLFGNTKRALPAIDRGQIIMEIKYSSEVPSKVERNGVRRTLNYNVRETTQEEIQELWERQGNEGTPDNGFILSHKYAYNSVSIGMGRWNYQGIVEAIIRDKYTADEMEAIINNMNAITAEFFNVLVTDGILSATKYLLDSINDENTKNFKEMQEWRINAKKIAKEIIK